MTKYVQSRLLQNCRMRERVNGQGDKNQYLLAKKKWQSDSPLVSLGVSWQLRGLKSMQRWIEGTDKLFKLMSCWNDKVIITPFILKDYSYIHPLCNKNGTTKQFFYFIQHWRHTLCLSFYMQVRTLDKGNVTETLSHPTPPSTDKVTCVMSFLVMLNPAFPNTDAFWCICSRPLLKTLRQKYNWS